MTDEELDSGLRQNDGRTSGFRPSPKTPKRRKPFPACML